jgi:hypothetical protein
MITEYNSEMFEIIFGLTFFVVTMTATLLPWMITSFKLARAK